MKNIFFSILILFFSSCVSLSLTPSEVNNILPTLTKSKYYNQLQANEAKNNNKCKLLVKERNYVAPIGFTAKDDLKNGAKGIDEWVEIDGGNAYTLLDFKWETVDDDGSTQLHINFNTMLCK